MAVTRQPVNGFPYRATTTDAHYPFFPTVMKRVHYTDPYLLNPQNPVTVNLIGAGGTGSRVLTILAQLNHALLTLGHAGLQVRVWDDDTVSEANLGRQLFAPSEVGYNKGVALVERVNRFFGTYWTAMTCQFSKHDLDRLQTTNAEDGANLYISAVDTVAARMEIASLIHRQKAGNNQYQKTHKPMYWLDFGNNHQSGQAILGSVGTIQQPDSTRYEPVGDLPFVTTEFGDVLSKSETEDTGPSCSLTEALTKQDLLINPIVADLGCQFLWNLFRKGYTEHRGVFVNLSSLRTQPLLV